MTALHHASVDIEFLLPQIAEGTPPGGNGRHAPVEVRRGSFQLRRHEDATGGSGGSQVRSAAAALSDVDAFPSSSWWLGG